MKVDIQSLVNKYSKDQKDCVIVGSGHTMNDFDYKNFDGKIIFCGTAILRLSNIQPDYLISCNNHFPVINIESHLDFLNQYPNMTWIFSDTGCYHDIWDYDEALFEKLIPNYTTFDDRHLFNKKCLPEKKCCKLISKTSLEIFEENFKIKYPFENRKGVSIADHALIFAILMGFSKIYIQGIDLPTNNYQGKRIGKKYFGFENEEADKFLDQEVLKICRKKYFIYYLKNFKIMPYIKSFILRIKVLFKKDYSFFEENIETSLNIISWISEIGKKNNQKIYNLSPKSSLRKVKDIKYISTI